MTEAPAHSDPCMAPAQFKAWRKAMGLKQKEAAEKLGLKKRMIQYYETGRRGGRKVDIPKTVRLACYALSAGVEDFDGTASNAAAAREKPAPAFRTVKLGKLRPPEAGSGG